MRTDIDQLKVEWPDLVRFVTFSLYVVTLTEGQFDRRRGRQGFGHVHRQNQLDCQHVAGL